MAQPGVALIGGDFTLHLLTNETGNYFTVTEALPLEVTSVESPLYFAVSV